MARQHTQIRLDSVPAFLHNHLDRKRAYRATTTSTPEQRSYLKHRRAGRVPLCMAQKFMNLIHQGVGTYTDELGVAWYRDDEEIVRVTTNLDWIEQKAQQDDIPRQKRAAQMQLQDNSDTSLPSSSGDYELPQERGYNTAPPRNPRRRNQRRKKKFDVEWFNPEGGGFWELIPNGENVTLREAEDLGYAFRREPQFGSALEKVPEIRVTEHTSSTFEFR